MKSITHTTSFQIQQPIKTLFPLFSPEGETRWVPGWSYRTPMESAELSEDYIFITSDHAHNTSDAIWIVKRYDPENHYVQFYKIEPGQKIGVITVCCSVVSEDVTTTTVSYTYTALSESGEVFISQFDEPCFESFICEWKVLIERYFENRG